MARHAAVGTTISDAVPVVPAARPAPPGPIPLESWRTIAAAAFFFVLTGVLTYPFSVHPASTVVVDAPDTHLYLWTLAWDVHAFLAQPFSIFDANIYHPNHGTLAYSENLIGSALLAAPVIWTTGNLVLALNAVQLISTALCGLGAYLLGRRVGLSPLASVLAGVVFLAAPPRFFRFGQVHLVAVQWVPFGLLFLHGYLDTGRRRDLRLAVACFTLQALATGHGAIFLGVAMAALFSWRVAMGDDLAPLRRLRDFGVAGLALLAPLVPLYAPYRAAQREVGLVRSLENWLPTVESYVASPSHLHTWVRGLFTRVDVNARASAWLFPGIVVVLLAIVAAWPAGRTAVGPGWRERVRRDPGTFYFLLAVLAVLFFLPPPIGLWPHVYAWPGFNFIRVPSRFMILAMLGLGVAAAAGLDRLTERSSPRGRATWAALAITAILVEYAAMPLAHVRYSVEVPAVDRWLAAQPKPFAIAEVPVPSIGRLGDYERHQTMAMLHSTAHWQKTVHGYSGIRPALHDRLYEELNAFPDERSLRSLRELGVRYVVVHDERYDDDRREEVARRFERFAPHLRLEFTEGTGRVYSILPAPAEPALSPATR